MLRTKPFPSSFFKENRDALAAEFSPDAIILIQSAEPMVRNADLEHSWRQDSSFFYFTGIDQPGCYLLMVPESDGGYEEYLFIPTVDPEKEKWTGKMITKREATEASGVKKVQDAATFPATFYRLQKWKRLLYCDINDIFPDQPLTQQHLFLKDIQQRLPGLNFGKLGPYIARLRFRKKAPEIAYTEKSIAIIKEALDAVLGKLKPGLMEYQVEAELIYHYLLAGCNRVGFEAIVAGGRNATMLHYVANADRLNDGELILIDTGAEYGMYSGDITRTFPINGRFTDRQRKCYQAVLDVNKRFIETLKPGQSWKQLYETAGEITGEIYAENGFVTDPKKYADVSYHRIGHFLGLDVHDVGRLDWPMEAGTMITVEPGLYLPDENLGIRIEDNVLFTESGVKVLSKSIPKELDEIETLMSNRR